MSQHLKADLAYDVRTVLGFLIILAGVLGGLYLGWWFFAQGDVVQIIHDVKMRFPSWAWLAFRVGFSLLFWLIFIGVFVALGLVVLSGRRR
ncbi:MAG: hypothetical protein P8Y66_11490 [Nitrospirota bacterium]|jgi:hypothetical protein